MNKQEPSGIKIIAVNNEAKFRYHILENFEAGLVLTGAEIKAIREGKINLAQSYVRPVENNIFLIGAHIAPYSHGVPAEYDPTRPRKLLLHKREIDKLRGRVEQKGLTIVPLKIYLKRGYAKLEIALARGKNAPDKRRAVKDREAKRAAQRAMKGE